MTTQNPARRAAESLPNRPRTIRPTGRRRASVVPYLFLAPAILLLVVLLLIPIGYAVYLSFQGLRVAGGGAFGKRQQVFVGFDNYFAAVTGRCGRPAMRWISSDPAPT